MNQNQLRLLAFVAELERQHGKAHPRVRSIAGALSVSEATVHRSLRALKAVGLLKISKRRTRSGKQITSKYTLTNTGKALIKGVTPLSASEAQFAVFSTQEAGGRVSPKTATGVSGVSTNTATGVSSQNAPETPSQTQNHGGRVSPKTVTPLSGLTPLNKEHPETPGGERQESAAPEGRPPELPPHMLTGIPGVDDYLKRAHARRLTQGPDPLQAQVDLIEARRQAREAN